MKLKAECLGRCFRKPFWPIGQYYLIQHFGRDIVLVQDDEGKEHILNRNDLDKDWLETKIENHKKIKSS